jgi:lipoprotein-anchoring transpeptidase ErfK/SrfK
LLTLFIYRKYITLLGPCGNSISCKTNPKLQIENDAVGIYRNKPVAVPDISQNTLAQSETVLGTNTSSTKKHIYVNLTKQMLHAYEGDTLILKTPVSTGLWGKTPTGTFTIWSKFVASRMTGGSGEDFYDLPNVPYVMFFSNDEVPGHRGFSLHGTYWHNNFGHKMSHGCVNLRTIDAKKMYEWTEKVSADDKGTLITIYEDTEL